MAFPVVAVLGALGSVGKWLGGMGVKWFEDRAKKADAKLEADLSVMRAKAELAHYIVKSEVEWDLKWAEGAQNSWKDEFLLVLWAIPLIMLFIPGLDGYAHRGFENMGKYIENAAAFYATGWGIIFSAVFGMRAAARMMAPGRTAEIIKNMSAAPDDIPNSVIEDINNAVKAAKGSKR